MRRARVALVVVGAVALVAACGDDADSAGLGISRDEFVEQFAVAPEERAEAECIYDALVGSGIDLAAWAEGGEVDLTDDQAQRIDQALVECFQLDDPDAFDDLDDLDEG